MPDFYIAAAQIMPVKGNVEMNIQKHIQLIYLVAENGAQLIVFPELSLTGYEPELADELAFSANDSRLKPLIEISENKNIVIIAGAPVAIEEKLNIGAYVIYPDNKTELYTKRYLHPGEEKYFSPGGLDPVVLVNQVRASIAICADLTNPQHASDAATRNSDLYIASAFITPNGYENDSRILKNYSHTYNMNVVLANFAGTSGGQRAAGRSAFWESGGNLVAELVPDREGALIIHKRLEEIQYNQLYL